MKCNQFIKTVTKPGKRAIVLPHRENIALERGWKLGKSRICGGDIKAEIDISMEDEDTSALKYPLVKIEYVCQTCRRRYNLGDRGFPIDLEELQNFISNEVENLE